MTYIPTNSPYIMELCISANSTTVYHNEPFAYPTRLAMRPEYAGHSMYHLYAYPKPRPRETIVQLQTQIPAIVSYVLGPTWRDELGGRQKLPVPKSNWTEADEHNIALRLLRGGGAILDHDYAYGQWWIFEDGFGTKWPVAERQKKYIFGWPDSGGVWVLHLPPLLPRHTNGEDNLADKVELMEHIEAGGREGWRKLDGTVNYDEVVGIESMDDFCGQLESAGAIHYPKINESPEVSECGLLDTETAIRKTPI